jgi:phosphoglycolate phosphatase
VQHPIRWVSFDLDGTLLDTVDDLHAACAGMLADLGRPALAVADVRRGVGRGMQVLVDRCLDGEGRTPPELLGRGVERFRHHYRRENGRNARFFDGVLEGLEAFRGMGLPLAVVTNKPVEFSETLLERTALRPYFARVLGGDSLPEKKPSPAQILDACRHFGLAPADGLHIGDSRHDLEAARAAGCRYFHVPYGYGEGAGSRPVAPAECDALVSGLADAAARVGRINQGLPVTA